MKILITCRPMANRVSEYGELLKGLDIHIPQFDQIVPKKELLKIVPQYDGWIIGDDQADRDVIEAGAKGQLKACVKWGVGVDNVDFEACKEFGIPISNTPAMFGEEVADVAVGYVLGLARDLFATHYFTVRGEWYKPCGISLTGKKVCLVGLGDIGQCIVRRLAGFRMDVWASDPTFGMEEDMAIRKSDGLVVQDVRVAELEECLAGADFIVVACALNNATRGLINRERIKLCKEGVRIVNVSRGPIVVEKDIVDLQAEKFIHGVAFDVFEVEPLPVNSGLRRHYNNIFGSHNGSNTVEAVDRASAKAVQILRGFLA